MKGNPFNRVASVRKPCAALLTVAMLTMAPLASAQSMHPGHDTENLGKALGFLGCAAAIVLASSTVQYWMAGLVCARVMATEIGI